MSLNMRPRLLGGNKVYDMPPASEFPNRLPQFRAQVSGARAARMMVDLYPMLGRRRKARIDEILSEYSNLEPTRSRRTSACSAGRRATSAAIRRYIRLK